MNEILTEDNVFLELPFSKKSELFKYLIKSDATRSVNNWVQTLKDVLKRESELSTGIVKGIAIPHGISSGVTKAAVIIGKLKYPIDWETIDGQSVNLVFLILSPKESKDQTHLKILAKIAEQLADEDVIEKIIKADSADQIINLLKEEI